MAKQDRPNDEKFELRRTAARQVAGGLQRDYEESGDRLGWFEAVYDGAKGDFASVPWADLEPHPGLADWTAHPQGKQVGRALDIGCGLGDNAEHLSALGFDVIAFDLSQTAVDWARKRFPKSRVHYCVADLFNMPDAWLNAFDLVHETYTLQALPIDMREEAIANLVATLAPGGQIMVVARIREEDEHVEGPPWPLALSELAPFLSYPLELTEHHLFDVENAPTKTHVRAVYKKIG